MPSDIRTDLRIIVQNIRIHSDELFSLAGKLYHRDATDSSISASEPNDMPLLSRLQNVLYERCYCQTFNPEAPDHPPFGDMNHDFLQTLTNANMGRGRWEHGWEAKRIMPSGQMLVEKYQMMRILAPGEIPRTESDELPAMESKITIQLRNDSTTVQPGFYVVYGEAPSDEMADNTILRFYFNLQASGAEKLIASLTHHLNRFQIPFQFKCPTCPSQYYRKDAGVLYIQRRYYRIVATLLKPVHDEIQSFLESDTPLFTKPLARGLGFAEDPGGMSGFGMHRCRILAQGLWDTFKHGAQETSDRYDLVEKYCTTYGLSLDYPYLNPKFEDHYTFPITDRNDL